jgi:hypothetical protein
MGPMVVLGGCVKVWPPTGIRSPDRPARSESLYRLSYPGPLSFPQQLDFKCPSLSVSYRGFNTVAVELERFVAVVGGGSGGLEVPRDPLNYIFKMLRFLFLR